MNTVLQVLKVTKVLNLTDYVAEMVVKYRIPLTLAHTASRGYHLQQTIPRPKKRDNNPTARLPAPVPPLPPVFICVSVAHIRASV